jgi:hypothetical protein
MGYVPGSAKSHVRSQIGADRISPATERRKTSWSTWQLTPLAQFSAKSSERILEPMDRIAEVLFGLIMALTFTLTLGVVTADRIQVRTMLLAAPCNLAWGIIDAAVFLMARFNQRGRSAMQLQAVRTAANIADAHRIIADALPPVLALALSPDQLELIRQRLLHLPEAEGPRLTKRDGLGAVGICLLSFLSTFPIVIPFILIGDTRLALRLSNAVAIGMLFLCGYAFGRYAGFRPWATGLSMVAVGAVLVGVAIVLGG